MFAISLIGSLILVVALFLVNRATFQPHKSVGWAALFFVGFAVFPGFCMMYSPVLALNALLVVVACAVCALVKPSVKIVRSSVVAATVASYLIVGVPAGIDLKDDHEALQKYPLLSMRSRLAYERSTLHRSATIVDDVHPLNAATNLKVNPEERSLLEFTEKEVTGPQRSTWSSYDRFRRNGALMRLHSSAVTRFINSPGFGVTRMSPYNYGPEVIDQQESDPIPQPASPANESEPYPAAGSDAANVLADAEPDSPPPTEPELWDTHSNNVVEFVNDGNFGYYLDREHVAGFQSHRFRQAPRLHPNMENDGPWRIGRVELVSLLKHAEPRVYESDHLPNMDELKQAPTRALDGFERAALPLLVEGKDIAIDERPDHVRLLGSLRAGKQCQACHEVERGKLLGAFSYRIIRTQERSRPKRNVPARPVTQVVPPQLQITVAHSRLQRD